MTKFYYPYLQLNQQYYEQCTIAERCTLRSDTIFENWKLFNNDEKCFLFHLKIKAFCSQDNYFSVLFSSICRKTTLLERLISKFMMSEPGKQTIAIHILPNISRSRGNQTMKFGQLIKYNIKNIFLEK